MAANIYIGPGRSAPAPLPILTNNTDVTLMKSPLPVGSNQRACDTQVKVRNSGTGSASVVVHLCYYEPYVTGGVLVQCSHQGVPSMTAAQTVPGGGAPVAFRVTGDIPNAPTKLVGVAYVNGVFLNATTPPWQNPVCGVKFV
jgi:hypothetical protein